MKKRPVEGFGSLFLGGIMGTSVLQCRAFYAFAPLAVYRAIEALETFYAQEEADRRKTWQFERFLRRCVWFYGLESIALKNEREDSQIIFDAEGRATEIGRF